MGTYLSTKSSPPASTSVTGEMKDDYTLIDSSHLPSSNNEIASMISQLKQRIKLLRDLSDFYAERASVESSFANGLVEVSKVAEGMTDENMNIRDILKSIQLETKKQGNHHTADSNDIHTKLIALVALKIQESEDFLQKELAPALTRSCLDSSEEQQDEKSDHPKQQSLNNLRQSYQRLEVSQLELLKDTLWSYANLVSTTCVNDDNSAEEIRLSLEKFQPSAVEEDSVSDVADSDGAKTEVPSSPVSNAGTDAKSRPLPEASTSAETREASCSSSSSSSSYDNNVLFYVKALYDYTPLTPEEFEFKANDILAVTKSNRNGWWTGYVALGQMPEKTEDKVFPSNYVSGIQL